MIAYYRSDTTTIYLADCREILGEMPSESMDCVVTDPPYGVSWQSNTRKDRFDRMQGDGVGEARSLLDEVAPDVVRVTRRTRHIYTFGLQIEHPLVPVKADLVWDKSRIGSGDLSQSWGPSHEPIFFHVRAADKTNAEKGAGGLSARLRRGSVIRVPRLSANQVKNHPTEKPVALMRQLIESSTNLGEIVLDPFAGSGSTLVAAVIEGRKSIGIEIEEEFCEIAARRVQDAEACMDRAVAA